MTADRETPSAMDPFQEKLHKVYSPLDLASLGRLGWRVSRVFVGASPNYRAFSVWDMGKKRKLR